MKYILNILSFLIFTGSLLSQDLHFSQINMTNLYLNAANTGLEHDFRGIATYRTQWAKAANTPFQTMMASYDMSFLTDREGSWGGGIFAYQDVAGDSKLTNTNIMLSAAYHQSLNEYNTVSVGFQGGMSQRSISTSGIFWGSQYDGMKHDPTILSGEKDRNVSQTNIDMGSGISWKFAKEINTFKSRKHLQVITGVSVSHLNRPNQSYSIFSGDDNRYMKFSYHTIGIIDFINYDVRVFPTIMYMKQGPNQQFMVGGQVLYKINKTYSYHDQENNRFALGGGLMFRSKDAVVISALFEYRNYMFGFTYDTRVYDFGNNAGSTGAFELNLKYAKLKDNSEFGKSKKFKRR